MRFPKPQTFRSQSLRDLINRLGAEREMPCMCGCGRFDGTVVAAHSNFGKGMSLKSSDSSLMGLSAVCHARLDQPGQDAMPREERRAFEERVNLATLRWLVENGYLTAGR